MAATEDRVGDCPDDDSVNDDDHDYGKKLLRGSEREIPPISSYPPSVQRRIKALKKIQLENTHLEAKFFEEVHAIECKYHKLFYVPLYEKRARIVTGEHEPTDEEAQWVSDDEEDLAKEFKDKAKTGEQPQKELKEAPAQEDAVPAKGIPDFWLTIFKNSSLLSDMVQEHDEPILKHLEDIKVDFNESPMGFVLKFHFGANEYFSNAVLTKEYDMKCVPDEEDPFDFGGPEIYRSRGCTINWNKGKNVTLKTVKKKQKHKSRGVVRTVTKTVQNDSFFNFFSPTTVPEDENGADVDEETRELLTSDFEIGHFIRESVVPRAVLYFTGEELEDDDYEEEEEDDEEEEEEDDDSDAKESKPADQNCKQQ